MPAWPRSQDSGSQDATPELCKRAPLGPCRKSLLYDALATGLAARNTPRTRRPSTQHDGPASSENRLRLGVAALSPHQIGQRHDSKSRKWLLLATTDRLQPLLEPANCLTVNTQSGRRSAPGIASR